MNITVKRSELGGLASWVAAAKANVAYAGSATIGGTDTNQNEQVVITLSVIDETPSTAVDMAPGIGVTEVPE